MMSLRLNLSFPFLLALALGSAALAHACDGNSTTGNPDGGSGASDASDGSGNPPTPPSDGGDSGSIAHDGGLDGSIDGASDAASDASSDAGSDASSDGATPACGSSGGQCSLRFYGNGTGFIDRVAIDVRNRPVNIGVADFTIEFWVKAASGNNSGTCTNGSDTWTNGNIIVDRDIWSSNVNEGAGDFGVALYGGRIAFAVGAGNVGATTICANANLDSDANNRTWHHVAVTRSSESGNIRIYVDGQQRASGNADTGNVSYTFTGTPANTYNPYLVLGAEKHDVGYAFSGWIDELRLSTTVRYNSNFTPQATPFVPDAHTAALYHFDEGSGTTIVDANGQSNGERRLGGSPSGPAYSADTPF